MNLLAGRYEIINQLGGGGFAVTFLAKDHLQPSKPLCVVKQLRPDQTDPRVIDFFEREAAILEKLGSHPQIPRLLAHFPQDQNLYIVQEFIEGQDLSREIQEGKRLSESYVTKLLQDVLEVLSFVHNQGVIHRDIKPQNLMRRHSDGRIFLIDFGAVKQLGTIMFNSQRQTAPSAIIGTPGFMPTEQGIGRPCLASDVYALGMTAIQALTGMMPLELEEDPQTFEIIWRQHATVSDRLAQILDQMVSRDRSQRYSSATQALEALTNPAAPTVPSIPSKQQYLQEASLLAQQGSGKFSVVALRILELKRIELGLSEDQAREITEQILQPYREYERNLGEYEKALIDAIGQKYPLNESIKKDLLSLRQYLGLKDSDVAAIEQRILAPKQAANERELKSQQALLQKLSSQTSFASVSQSQSLLPIQVQEFEFEFATLKQESSGFFGRGKTWKIFRSRERAKYFTESLGNGIVLEMVAIKGGKFLMGSPEDEEGRKNSESPQHLVSVPSFFIGKFPITQAQWKAVAALPKVRIDLKPDPSYFKGLNRPVELVSWNQAVEFCARLSKKTGKHYRLPSEAEWEYAARGGTKRPFHFGNTITTNLANYNGNNTYGSDAKGVYRRQTTDVGNFPANAFGLHDIHGNIWEWCQDTWHDNYNGAPTDGSAWVTVKNNNNDGKRLLRGGSWDANPDNCRSAVRDWFISTIGSSSYGFRVVVSLA